MLLQQCMTKLQVRAAVGMPRGPDLHRISKVYVAAAALSWVHPKPDDCSLTGSMTTCQSDYAAYQAALAGGGSTAAAYAAMDATCQQVSRGKFSSALHMDVANHEPAFVTMV